MTAAEELRAAAAKIRNTARNATPGPWTVGERGEVDEIDYYERPILGWIKSSAEDGTPFEEEVKVAVVSYHTNGFHYPHAEAKAEAEHIALWNPIIAMLVHDWLIGTAAIAEAGYRPVSGQALDLARAINGGEPEPCDCFAPLVSADVLAEDLPTFDAGELDGADVEAVQP